MCALIVKCFALRYDASKPGDWLKVAKPAIQERMQKVGLDGKFNLMSVVPSKLEDLKKSVFKEFCLKQRLSVKLISLDAHVRYQLFKFTRLFIVLLRLNMR